MQIPSQDKAERVRCPRVVTFPPAGWIRLLPLLPLLFGCASAARYATGPLPPSALPEPRVRLEALVPMGVEPPPPMATADVKGRVRRVSARPSPAQGFRLEIEGPTGPVMLEVITYAPAFLDLAEGRDVRLRATLAPSILLRLDDEQGPLFFLSAGPSVPEARDLPIDVGPAPRRTYVEVSAADDLCRWTVVQRSVEVASKGSLLATLGPGTSATVQAGGHQWLVTAVVASSPEESDCGREGEPRFAFFWSRIS